MAKFQVERASEKTALQVLSRLATVAGSLPECAGCTLMREGDPPAPYVLVEEWDSEEALQRHFSSQGFLSVLTHFGAHLGAPGPRNPPSHPSMEERSTDAITLRVSRETTSSELQDFARTQSVRPRTMNQ